jgi:hypothetical protein
MFQPPSSVRSFLCCSLAVLSAAMAASPARGQNAHSLIHWVSAAADDPCGAVWLAESDAPAPPMHLRQSLFDRRLFNFEPLCAPISPVTGLTGVSSAALKFPPGVTSRFAEDPVETELAAMGSDGMLIAGARQQVLEILREGNSCSGWFAQEEPNPAVKFASLHFQSDAAGSSFSLGEFDAVGFSIVQPYVARAQENVGPGSMITLNAHGAFFQRRAGTMFRLPGSGPHSGATISILHVGDYQGGSLKAQVATLLHEYAHIVGLIPVDTGRPDAAQLSKQNTETVLHHCRKQIDASPNRTILLPASFAHF